MGDNEVCDSLELAFCVQSYVVYSKLSSELQLSAYNMEMARIRVKLENKWRNEKEELVYTSRDEKNQVVEIQLTPFLIKEWCRAIVS